MTEQRQDPDSLKWRTLWELSELTVVISVLNILLSKLYSSSSNRLDGSGLCVYLSDTALIESGTKQVFIAVGPLYEHGDGT